MNGLLTRIVPAGHKCRFFDRFRSHDMTPSRMALESYEQARRDFDEQQAKHLSEASLREAQRSALAENHLAQLVYNALRGNIMEREA